MKASAKGPIDAPALFWMRKSPRDSTLVTRVQAGAALNAVFELEVDIPLFIKGVALGRTHSRRALMGTRGITDVGIHLDMRPGV